MWYVIWTNTGYEQKTKRLIEKRASAELYNRVFVPVRNVNAKRKGIWTTVPKALFPGYLFVDTDHISEFSSYLWSVPGFQKILSADREYLPLIEHEDGFIESLYRKGEVFDISVGIIEGDEIRILSGPLLGMEGLIKKINRHKRKAVIEVSMSIVRSRQLSDWR